VALGNDGIIEGIRPGSIVVDMSSSQLDLTRKIGTARAAKGCGMVDGIVGRAADHTVTGTLTLMDG